MIALPDLICSDCAARYPVESLVWQCSCGGVLDVAEFAIDMDIAALPGRTSSLWRYAEALPIEVDQTLTLGEGLSPLVPARALSHVQLKLDFLLPTLSFKDRGAVVLATLAKRLGVTRAMVDSSGNAGTAMAAFFGRAGIGCTVYVPESTSPAKLRQMRAHGATVELVPGSRAATSAAALQAAGRDGVLYASHVYHPYFLHGVKTYGYEIWEQRERSLPETVVVPVGNGTLVLGCYLAFSELVAAGLAERMPRIVAVQASACSPLEQAMALGRDEPVVVESGATIADGIAIALPPRGRQVLRAVRATGGTIVSVADEQIAAARQELADEGLFVEPTAAVCFAAVRAAVDQTFDPDSLTWAGAASLLTAATVVVPLCGAGLKSPGDSTPMQAILPE